MKKQKKKSNDWLIALIATLIVAAVTICGVLYLERLLEKNKAQSVQNEQITMPETNEEPVTGESGENKGNQEEPQPEATEEPAEQRQEENIQPAQEQSTPATEPEQPQQSSQESGTAEQPEQGATPVPTDTPLGENELPDF